MQKVRLFLVFVFLVSSFLSFSQKPHFSVDTLSLVSRNGSPILPQDIKFAKEQNDYKALGEFFYFSAHYTTQNYFDDVDSLYRANQYFTIANEYFILSDMSLEHALSVEQQASIAFKTGKLIQAVQLFQKAIQLHEKVDSVDYEQIALLHTNIGFIYLNLYRYENALAFFDNAFRIGLTHDDVALLSKSLYYKGLVFYEQEVFDSTYYYYEQALAYDLISENVNEIIASYNNMAVVLIKKNKFSLAEDKLRLADEYVESSNYEVKAVHANNIGNVYYYSGDYSKALALYTESLDIKKEIGVSEESLGISLHNIARVFLQSNVDSAKKFILQALEVTQQAHMCPVRAEVCRTASLIYERLQEYQKSLELYECFVSQSYSVFADAGEQISEDYIKYQEGRLQAASMQREIRMQQLLASYDFAIKRAEIQVREGDRKTEQMFLYIILGIIIFIIVVLIFIINQYLLKKRANKKLEQHNAEIENQNQVIYKQHEQLLLSNQEFEKLSIVASNTDNAIVIMDSKGNYQWINVAFTKIFGYSFDEFCEKKSSNIISDSTPEHIKNAFSTCVSEKKTVHYELNTQHKNGSEVWLNVTLTPILDKNGELSRLVMIDSDISDLKQAEREIQMQKNEINNQKEELTQQRDEIMQQSKELEKQKEQLAQTLKDLQEAQDRLVESEKMAALGGLVAGISHEINTPVGVGLTAATSLLTQTNELYELFASKNMKLSHLQSFISTAQHACELILKNLHRTADLVKSFNKVSVDNMSEQKRSFNLKEYLEDIYRSLAPKVKGRPVSLSVDCQENIELYSYPGAFAQIFTNLIINSLTHAFGPEDKGDISVKVSEQGEFLRMIYTDNGKGIPQENHSKIFEAFFTTNTEEGTGLGMNITYNIVVQKLGGEIKLDSSEGNGVVFTIEIPLANVKP